MIERLFGKEARERIAAAVRDAEARTTGQIVPVVVERSDGYPEARLRGALYAAALAGAAGAIADHWVPLPVVELVGAQLLAALAGALLASWDPLERLLARGAPMARATRQRALRAFHENDLHHTRDGTGVLVFASLFERRAVILGDHGIHARMGDEEWQRAVDLLSAGMGAGDPARGFRDAIAAVGARLAEHFPRPAAGPEGPGNELPDALRTGED
jgi:putative membrane protein